MSSIEIRRMTANDVETVSRVFLEHGIRRTIDDVTQCWEENAAGSRITFLGFYDGRFAGSLHVLAKSHYPWFAEQGIPEINDFNVISPLRRRGIGNALMEAAESCAFETHDIVGIGVGLFKDYGSAQRMYAARGYIPDGRGLMYKQQPAAPGSFVRVDDDLNLYFTKAKR
ncbi:GNAT family N-acetyltransferase [Paenibacillus humicola]|uniref:GNAT family N-acetyltransferase n=1 Tax=Paenibacillus humicola TaxID=3110540 RepID=UPI00237AAB7F|nr:GNAT family N-acetyltransferase [Paenibacillus humicola]